MDLTIRRDSFKEYDDGTDALIMRTIKKVNTDVTTIPAYAFYGCSQLEEVNAPNATRIESYAFSNCTSLPSFEGNNITYANNYAFQKCTSLTSLKLPELTTCVQYLIQSCSNLETLYLPKLATTQANAFRGSSLKICVLPKGGLNGQSSFAGVTTLQTVDTGASSIGGNYIFNGCTALTTIILRSTSVAALTGTTPFTTSPFASDGTGGTIYIPKSLYDQLGTGTNDYKAATNWSTIDGYGTITWAKIEGSQYEHYYADGTPIPAS